MHHDPEVRLHPSIVKALEEGWTLQAFGRNALDHAVEWEGNPRYQGDKHVFCYHVTEGNAWVRFLARVQHLKPVVEVVFVAGYGHTGTSLPEFFSQNITVMVGKRGPYALDTSTVSGVRVHGQPLGMTRVLVDFEQDSVESVTTSLFKETEYAPRNPNKTGTGKYMGRKHPITSYPSQWWRDQLYPICHYPGIFVRPGGKLVEEKDYPDAIGTEHFHRYGGDHWIDYPESGPWPKSPWDCPDDQHMSIYCALNQWARHSQDLGAILLSQLGARRFLRQIPGRPKGTTHHLRGADRGEGRPLKECIEFYRTMKMIGDPVSYELATRGHYLYKGIKDYAKANIEWPFYPYGVNREQKERGGASPAFAGVIYWALLEVEEVFDANYWDAELNWLLNFYEKWIFDQWFWSDLPGERGWVVPYVTFPDGTNTGPSSMGKYCWLAAMNYTPETEAEREKQKQIAELRLEVPVAWRT